MKLEEIDLYLTNRCNLSCDFCSVEARKNTVELSIERIKSIILEAKELGLQDLHLTGGEPTMRTDLEEIVNFAVSQGLNVRLITNGTLLTPERLRRLYEKGLKSIMISLDGMEAYHNKVRGDGSYERALESIQVALGLGMFVRVNSVAWKDNRSDILKLSHMLNTLNVAVYSIFLGSPLGYAKKYKDAVIAPQDWKIFCDELKSIACSVGFRTKIVVEKGYLYPDENLYDIKGLQGRGRGCRDITNYSDFFLIRSNGDVHPCVFFSNEASAIGNVNTQSLEEILHNYADNVFYQKIGQIPETCSKCDNADACRGGCRGYAKLYFDDWMKRDPRCVDDASGILPLCPIIKYNLNEGIIGGSSEQVLK